jgi:ligand-binding SRPBCC domain-containing protein
MTVHTLSRCAHLPHPVDRVFDFFSRAENLEAITPPWLRFRIVTPTPVEMREGALIEYSLRLRGLPIRWLTRIEEWRPPHRFVDVQLRGPYLLWEHTHEFSSRDGGTEMTDAVRYALPFGRPGDLACRRLVARDLRSIFDYRARHINLRMRR